MDASNTCNKEAEGYRVGERKEREKRRSFPVQLYTEEEKGKFLKEYKIISKLSLPMQMPYLTRIKEMLYSAAQELGIPVVEINTKEIQDTSALIEQVSIEEKKIVRKEGILARAIKKGYWLIVNAKETEDSVVQYIAEKCKEISENEEAKTNNSGRDNGLAFQVFIFTKDYMGGSSSNSSNGYPFILPEEETEEVFMRRAAASIAERVGGRLSTAESLLSIATNVIERYIGEKAQDIRKEEKARNEFEMVLGAMLYSICKGGTGEEERVCLFAAVEDAFLAQKAPEQREMARNDLLQFLCVPESAAEEYEVKERKRVLGCMQAHARYVVTNAAARLISFVVRNTWLTSSFLLVGETGTGKTTAVQEMFLSRKVLLATAHREAQSLLCVNLSKDTDLCDLLGTYHFSTLSSCCTMLNDIVQGFFSEFFVPEKNEAFLNAFKGAAEAGEAETVQETATELLARFQEQERKESVGRQKETIERMQKVLSVMKRLQEGAKDICMFIEGPLTRAFMYGYWILLDESNLASESVLEYLSNAMQREALVLLEDGGRVVYKDPRTAIFQCMNPGDDYGKKEIYMGRTMQLWMDEVDRWPEDVEKVAQSYRVGDASGAESACNTVSKITQFYTRIRQVSRENALRMGSGRPALFGIRNLIRAVQMANKGSVVQAIETSFLTQLCMAHKSIGRKIMAELFPEEKYVPQSYSETSTKTYTVTPQTETYLNEISAAISARTAVLLEGSTSVGKTSMVKHLARIRGKKIVRMNNHEHTDVTEYLGSYTVVDSITTISEEKTTAETAGTAEAATTEKTTKRFKKEKDISFVYKEGALVSAVRNGDWVLLDELNLAPTEVLESLNRLLDSNRELFIPATQETVRAHPEFALFATQNPAESLDYKNRKNLSKAFRNRFIEIFVEERSKEEMEAILHGAHIGKVSIRVLLEIYEGLRTLTGNRAQEYATLREIMRIARRVHGKQPSFIDAEAPEAEVLFIHTMMVLTEKIGERLEKERICGIIEKAFEKAFRGMFDRKRYREAVEVPIGGVEGGPLLTSSVIQLLRKIEACWCAQESVLLVGPPGTGKTYLSEYTASLMGAESIVMSMHAGIELSDFVGGYVESVVHGSRSFIWKNGPLVQRMKEGGLLVIDEINLVPDSVLESLNEVFDDRRLRVHEIGMDYEAAESFRLIGTMNPGDDYGKREIGRSVANRFTIIQVDVEESQNEVLKYFMHYVERYGVARKYEENTQVYREIHKAISTTGSKIESAREAEILARYTAQHPETGKRALREIIVEGLEILSGKEVEKKVEVIETENVFGISPFILQKHSVSGNVSNSSSSISYYTFNAPSVKKTLYRVMQGLFSHFNILLEGPPGTGKTKMVMELGRKVGKRVTRINLSRETEMADLAGRNTPTENGIMFVEGELCRAIQRGDWIIIDEINLAAQSVIEGLNGCLDYRRALYVPEKGEVRMHPHTVIFATMNPKTERADGRKMLPRSFLSRFMRVKRGPMSIEDIKYILYQAETPAEEKRAELVQEIVERIDKYHLNLRDCLRHMAIGSVHLIEQLHGREAVDGFNGLVPMTKYTATEEKIYVGQAVLKGDMCRDRDYIILHGAIAALEVCIWGINKRWPVVLHGGIGQRRLVRFFAEVTGKKWTYISCHRDMETSDFLGRYVQGKEKKDQLFYWEDSPFIRAVESGEMILLRNINLVRNDVVDRLNSLFEIGGTLEVHEKGGNVPRIVEVHPETCIFLGVIDAGGKELSPALSNRAVHASMPSIFSAVDMAKILRPVEQKEKGAPLSSQGVHQIGAGIVRAHRKAKAVIGYDLFADNVLAAPYADMEALLKEHRVRSYIIEREIQAHIIDLIDNPLQKEVAAIWFWSSAREEEIESIIKRETETAIDADVLAFYRAADAYNEAKRMYKICAAYEEEARIHVRDVSLNGEQKDDQKDEEKQKLSDDSTMENALSRVEELKKSLSEGRSCLRAYFTAMDLPFIQRKDVSVRMAKIKLCESLLNHRKVSSALRGLETAKKMAEALESLPAELERCISLAESAPSAYEVLIHLLDICLLHGIDPLIFPEIEQIEAISRRKVERCIERTEYAYTQYKYGEKGVAALRREKKEKKEKKEKSSKCSSISTYKKEVSAVSEIRKRRKERRFEKFAQYLKEVIREVELSLHPETFAFSVVKREMSKYADLWECFAYAVLRSAIERIAEKEQTMQVHSIGLAILNYLTGALSAKESLQYVLKYLCESGISFLSLSQMHKRAVTVIWKGYVGESVREEEKSMIALSALLEKDLYQTRKNISTDKEGVCYIRYKLCRETEKVISTKYLFSTQLVDLSVKEDLVEESRVFASVELVSLISAAEKEIKTQNIKIGREKAYDWGENDGAKEKVLENVNEILATPVSLPQQRIAGNLDSLNGECAHIGVLSVPLNKARMMIYREFAEKSAYRIDRHTNINAGWLLHVFNAVEKKLKKEEKAAEVIEAFEEFLLQSTLGDMAARINIAEKSVQKGAPYEIENMCVYFRPYLEIAEKKKEKIEGEIEKELENMKIALSIRTRKDGVSMPIREESILSKSAKVMEMVDGLSTSILTIIRPCFFGSPERCTTHEQNKDCYVCLANEVEQKKAEMEKESMSVKLRSLVCLFEKLSELIPRETTKNSVPGAKEFYKKRFRGSREKHVELAKIMHLGGSVLREKPHVGHQVAVRIVENTTKAMNHALYTAEDKVYPFILAALRVFYELMAFGFCGEEDEALDGEIEELENAGMRLGEGEKNISEKLTTEEEVGDNYKDEKEKYEQEMEEEDGVDMKNEGEVQETAGGEEQEKAEVDEGSVEENEEKYNQNNKKEKNLGSDADADSEEDVEDTDQNGTKSEHSSNMLGSDESNSSIAVNLEKEEEAPEIEENEEVNIQEMELCSNHSSEYNRDAAESLDSEKIDEESLDQLELLSESSSSEEISMEEYSSDKYDGNVHEYSFEELDANTEQLFNNAEMMPSDDQVGHEEGEGAEREVDVGAGEAINDQAEAVDLFEGREAEREEEKDVVKRAAFKKSVQETDPVAYYKEIKHITSPELTKQLSVVLEENERGAYEGDYTSGRRLNMKRIVSYVASDGQKNRIWMRKTKKQGREYLIRIFVDNSGSIKNNGLVAPLVRSMSVLCNSLDLLGIPYELSTFSTVVQKQKSMQGLVESLTFSAQETKISWIFEEEYSAGHNIIISDGLFYDSSQTPGRLSNTILLVLGDSKIKEMRSVKVVVGEVVVGRYLEVLGLPYCIVDNESLLEFVFIKELKNMLLHSKRL